MAKLRYVLIVCVFFMITEIVGGLISNSLAILTDAAHMASDIAGFIISMTSIWIAQKNPTSQLTYGYHRAEVLGALTSIITIWILVAYLIGEATHRLIHSYEIDINANVMLVTSFVSLLCNIWNLIILEHCSIPCFKATGFMSSFQSIYKPHGGHSCGHDHGHHHHGHNHESESCGHSHSNNHSLSSTSSGCNHSHSHNHTSDNDLDKIELVSKHDEENCQHSHGHHHHHENDQSISHSTNNSCDEVHGGGDLNIRAAIVHAIGDLLQSIGVIIAAVLISIWPQAKIADPICTYLFSILTILTTVPVFKDCLSVLMEEQPIG